MELEIVNVDSIIVGNLDVLSMFSDVIVDFIVMNVD